jgi:hypothetical protein
MLPMPNPVIVPIPDRLIVPTPDLVMLPIPDAGAALEPMPAPPDAGGLTTPVCAGRVGTDCTMMIALGTLLEKNAP